MIDQAIEHNLQVSGWEDESQGWTTSRIICHLGKNFYSITQHVHAPIQFLNYYTVFNVTFYP